MRLRIDFDATATSWMPPASLPSKREAGITIIASSSSRKRHPSGFTVLSAADSRRRTIGIQGLPMEDARS
jgi:hypothetical protein